MSDENKKRKRPRNPKTIVRFVKPWAVHPSGEVAGFEPHVAQKLIDQGYAVAHNPNPAPAPVEEAPAAPAAPAEADAEADAEDKAADEPAPVEEPAPAPVEEPAPAPASTKKSSSKKS